MLRLFALLALLLALLVPDAHAVNYPQRRDLATARSYPFYFVGQIYFTSGRTDYIGSGTVIRKKSVLTAGHNVYDPSGGWSTAVEFRRSAYGSSALNDLYASRLYVLGGYRAAANTYGGDSLRAFSYDMGGLIFTKDLATGTHANMSINASLLSNKYSRVAVGYGAETHSGEYPLFVTPYTGFFPVRGAYWECNSITFEGGMSGGPLFTRNPAGNQVVIAVIVASAGTQAGGVRILDQTAADFINGYLY